MPDRDRIKSLSHVSEWTCVTSGVPQGSVLRPVLFALVIDSLRPMSDKTSFVKFADDVTIIHHFHSSGEDLSQLEWSNLEDWASNVGLHLNYSKCSVMNCETKKCLRVEPCFLL